MANSTVLRFKNSMASTANAQQIYDHLSDIEEIDPETVKLLSTNLQMLHAGSAEVLTPEEAKEQSAKLFDEIEKDRRRLLDKYEALERSQDESVQRRRETLIKKLIILGDSLKQLSL